MSANHQSQVDVWEKWGWLWNATFYFTLMISLELVFNDIDLVDLHWLVWLMSALMLVWHGVGIRFAYRGLESWEGEPHRRFVVIVGDIVLWFVLVNISPAYYFTLFGLFLLIFRHLPIRLASLTAIILTILMIIEQVVDRGETVRLTDQNVALFIFAGLVSIFIGIWISGIIGQSSTRRNLIEQLEATQEELADAKRQEGILEERQRLAREIHDTLAQGFTSIVMHLEAAEQALPDDLATLQTHLNQARSISRSSLDQARRVVQDLRPDLLEQNSLPDAIKRTASRWSEQSDIATTTQITGQTMTLHPNIEVMLLRATQEALNNIRKHAQATDVQITLSYMSDVIMLDIQDDGVGIDDAQPSPLSGGYGLQAMRERAEESGASVTLESDSGEGTTVVITVPILTETEFRQQQQRENLREER